MKVNNLSQLICTLAVSVLLCSCATSEKNQSNVDSFVNEMVNKHQFNKNELSELLGSTSVNPEILRKIAKPSEGLPWYKYRKIFLTKKRIDAGVDFWRTHQQELAQAEQKYGVPASIIVAILGIETFYGKHTGTYPVLESLSTLAFAYPPRNKFFRSELENFLLLCRNEKIDPLIPLGSYAGAMGMPQFMPSSYLKYAVDKNGDNKKDIWQNSGDVIASIANYFVAHGWQKGQPVISKIRDQVHINSNNLSFVKQNLRKVGLESNIPTKLKPLLLTPEAETIAFELENGEELWAPFHNFYVITRYNKSPLYALAAYQLSLALSNQIINLSYEQNHNDIFYLAGERMLDKSH